MSQPTTQTDVQPKRFQCRHIHAEGHRCGSPCLRGELFCFYHHTSRQPLSKTDAQDRKGRRAAFDLPLPEDRAAIQRSIGEVLRRIASHGIDPRRAGLLLYGLQIASLNLPKPPAAHTEPRPNARYRTRTSSASEEMPETVEEIVLHPTLGILAPEAELAEKEEYLSPAGRFLRELDETDDTPVLPTVSATAVPTPKRVSRPRRNYPARNRRQSMLHSPRHAGKKPRANSEEPARRCCCSLRFSREASSTVRSTEAPTRRPSLPARLPSASAPARALRLRSQP